MRENDGLWAGEGVPLVPSGSAIFRGEHIVLSSYIGARVCERERRREKRSKGTRARNEM